MTVKDICEKFKDYTDGKVTILHIHQEGDIDESDLLNPYELTDETEIDVGVTYGSIKNAEVWALQIDPYDVCLNIWI